jgi:hypothetical protein
MKPALTTLVAIGLTLASALPASAALPVQRYLLVIGANAGGPDRPKLQYAISDAEHFARVMEELGGVPASNEVILRQPKLKELIDALDQLNARVKDARRVKDAGRIEVILYYSGHADEQGLLLGSDRYSYRTLRDRLDDMPADVRIAVLDACASGAFTRLKGGKARPPFLVDESTDMRGHAFLTSSAETESAQESDRIHGSYFTHYLISGFRGAADLSGDGRITLNEAYQFAFSETLGRTVDTRGGAQHPSYDINLSGSGDVVITDVRQTTATLVLGEDLDGRFFIRNAAQELVVELYKPYGRKVELGLEPGVYEIRIEREKTALLAKTHLDDGATMTLAAKQFGPVALEATKKRGGEGPRLAVAGRNRIDLRFGGITGNGGGTGQGTVVTGVSDMNLFGEFQYTHYMREDLAAVFSLKSLGSAVGTSVNTQTQVSFSGTVDVYSIPMGVHWNPFTSKHPSSGFKPFVAVTIGPVFGDTTGRFVSSDMAVSGVSTQTTVGGHVGGGVDFHVGRPFAFGVNVGYNWMASFSRPVGPRDNYSGAEFGVGFGFLWGKGR